MPREQAHCWHCHVLLTDVTPARCEQCPRFDECEVPACQEPGCRQEPAPSEIDPLEGETGPEWIRRCLTTSTNRLFYGNPEGVGGCSPFVGVLVLTVYTAFNQTSNEPTLMSACKLETGDELVEPVRAAVIRKLRTVLRDLELAESVRHRVPS